MNNDIYYNTKTKPLAERETFNNTILLLTMVKSQYYYIVGFSRPDHKIEVAFDYETELHRLITESIIIDFASDEEFVLFNSNLKNIPSNINVDILQHNLPLCGNFINSDEGVSYELKIKKDCLIPTSIDKMNEHLLHVKQDIITFTEEYYKTLCSN